MSVLLTKCSSSGDRMNPDNVHTIKNRRSKNYGNKDPPLAMFLIQIVNAILGIEWNLYERDHILLKQRTVKSIPQRKKGLVRNAVLQGEMKTDLRIGEQDPSPSLFIKKSQDSRQITSFWMFLICKK